MKKLIIAVLALGLIGMFTATASAEYVGGGFEASGSVMAGVGYQHANNALQTEFATNDEAPSTAGVIGRYIKSPAGLPILAARQDNLEFFVDSVELDLMKSFGENIRLRADLDFGRLASGSQSAFFLEQAYATANIPLGNGVEILLGRFNVPIGFESVDPVDNDTISKSILIRSGIRPTNSTGMKFYYAFSDLVDLHFYIVNQLTRDNLFNGVAAKVSDIPSFGMRLGFNWGDPGTESTFGLSGFAGTEHYVSSKSGWTYGGDVDLNWWVTESFAFGLEGIFRKDSQTPGTAVGSMNTFGGLINLKYLFSDVWDGTIKYAIAHQSKATNGTWDFIGTLGIAKQTVHEVSLAGNYAIADGAKLKLEGRFDIVKPSLAGLTTQYVYGGALAFAYDF